MQSVASTTSASPASSDGPTAAMRVVLDEDVSAVEVSERGIHAEDVAAAEQHALGHDVSLPYGRATELSRSQRSLNVTLRDYYHCSATASCS